MPQAHDRSQTTPSGSPVTFPLASVAGVPLDSGGPSQLGELDGGSAAGPGDALGETRMSRVSLLGADRELAAAVPARERPRAQRALWSSAIAFPPGPVDLARVSLPPAAFALLVLKGVLTRQTRLSDRPMIELLLASDILSPWPPSVIAPSTETRLIGLDEVRLAVLDDRFMKAAAVWPALMVTIQRRLSDQLHRLAIHGAICQLPRVEQRVMAIMWLLAARSGAVTDSGTELAATLTHEALAQLTGSRRPTVSLAIKSLRERGYLERRDDGAWLLPEAPAQLGIDGLLADLSQI